MNAKEMFKELGFTKNESIEYINEAIFIHVIGFKWFDEESEKVMVHMFDIKHKSYSQQFTDKHGKLDCAYVPYEQIKAITQQMKELGWLE